MSPSINTPPTGYAAPPQPHQLANEMTADASVQAEDRRPDTQVPSPPRDQMVGRVEKRIGRVMGLVLLGAIIIGLILAALLMGQMYLFAIGALVVIPFIILVSAPSWMATLTKEAQDATVQDQRQTAEGAAR